MIDEHREDPWAAAREKQREDVAGIFAPRERRCPECGAVQQTGGRRCEQCGADLVAHLERGRSRRPLLFAAIVAVALAALSVPIIAGWRDDAAAERERAERRQQERIAAEAARQERDAQPVRAVGPPAREGEDPIDHRARLVTDAEAKITADARARIAAGTLEGRPPEGTLCEVFPETDGRLAAERDPATRRGRYDCVAFTSQLEGNNQNTAVFGHPFWLVIDYQRARYVWCKVTPRAGEGGSVLVSVPVPEPCRDPEGPG